MAHTHRLGADLRLATRPGRSHGWSAPTPARGLNRRRTISFSCRVRGWGKYCLLGSAPHIAILDYTLRVKGTYEADHLTNRCSRRRAGVLLRFHMTKIVQPAATRAPTRRG